MNPDPTFQLHGRSASGADLEPAEIVGGSAVVGALDDESWARWLKFPTEAEATPLLRLRDSESGTETFVRWSCSQSWSTGCSSLRVTLAMADESAAR
jgi:hypothetical protein